MRYLKDPSTQQNIAFFAHQQTALEHLCDHLLSHPEAGAWYLLARFLGIHEETAELLLTDSKQRYRLGKALWAEQQSTTTSQDERTRDQKKSFFDLYFDITQAAIHSATRTESTWEEAREKSHDPDDKVLLSMLGLFVVYRPGQGKLRAVLRSSFFPQHGSAQKTKEAKKEDVSQRRNKPLPRDQACKKTENLISLESQEDAARELHSRSKKSHKFLKQRRRAALKKQKHARKQGGDLEFRQAYDAYHHALEIEYMKDFESWQQACRHSLQY